MTLCKSFGKAHKKQNAENADVDVLRKAIYEYLSSRGEPASYLHIHTAGLIALEEANALKQPELEFDEALRKTQGLFSSALKDDERFIHYSTGENVDTGHVGFSDFAALRSHRPDALLGRTNRFQTALKWQWSPYLQKNPNAIFLEVEE